MKTEKVESRESLKPTRPGFEGIRAWYAGVQSSNFSLALFSNYQPEG
jgi:hypothetical protein